MIWFFKKKFISGALIDDRPLEEKQKDYLFSEIVATPEPVKWIEKPQSLWRRFPIFDQGSSGSCVACSLAKILGIKHQVNEGEWINFSAGFIYQQRKNKPQSGMWGIDAFEIVRKNGCLLEVFFPFQRKTDAELDSYQVKDYEKNIARIFKIGNYVILPNKDIETVASVIQKTGKGVMVWFYFTMSEWNRSIPEIQNFDLNLYAPITARHSVCAVDFTLYQGKKALIIEDSWGVNVGKNGQRIITEDFYKLRNYFTAYPIDFKYKEQETLKPRYQFTKELKFGMRDIEIKVLQDCLKWLGLFPLNIQNTGYFGSITRNGVILFQQKYEINSTGQVDSVTREKLNEIFGK